VQNALNEHCKPLKGSHVHIAGIAYKKNIDDVRESPALDVMLLPQTRRVRITYTDPSERLSVGPPDGIRGHEYRCG
jgi:UDP-N-acetyl-D-glucosamine dehydrogenase